MNKLKCGIIGLGNISYLYDVGANADTYFTHAKVLNQHQSFELTAASDINISKQIHFLENYNGVNVYCSYEEMLANHKFDIVIVATNTESHFEICKYILDRKLSKIILLEKPVSYLPLDYDNLLTLSESNEIPIFVNYIRNSLPSLINLKKRFLSSRAEKKIIVKYSKGFFNNFSHVLSLFCIDESVINVNFLNKSKRNPDSFEGFIETDSSILFVIENDLDVFELSADVYINDCKLIFDFCDNNVDVYIADNNSSIGNDNVYVFKRSIKLNDMEKYQLFVYENILKYLEGLDYHLCDINQLKIHKDLLCFLGENN